MAILCKRIEDDTIPNELGEWSLWHNQPRPWLRKEPAEEIFLKCFGDKLVALIPEVHKWSFENNILNVTPSIIRDSWHGFITNGLMS